MSASGCGEKLKKKNQKRCFSGMFSVFFIYHAEDVEAFLCYGFQVQKEAINKPNVGHHRCLAYPSLNWLKKRY